MANRDYFEGQPRERLCAAVEETLAWQRTGTLDQSGVFVTMARESGFDDDYRTFEVTLLSFVSRLWVNQSASTGETETFQNCAQQDLIP